MANAVLSSSFRRRRSSSQTATMESVHHGWLVKSPPEKRIRKAKWRRRWFVLRPSGQVPDQYVLEYYTDQTCRKLKGTIDLDQCEQVDAGLQVDSKSQFVFDIKTPKRIYYLVADSESVMNKWVECICSVCGLKMQVDEEPQPAPTPASVRESPTPSIEMTSVPPAPSPEVLSNSVSSLTRRDSNPYIPISECTTGKPIGNGFFNFTPNHQSTLPKNPPPPPPKEQNRSSADFYDTPPPQPGNRISGDSYDSPPTVGQAMPGVDSYDTPRPLKVVPAKDRTSPDPVMETMYKVPRAGQDILSVVPPPQSSPPVNWSTFPRNSVHSSNRHSGGKISSASGDLFHERVLPVRPPNLKFEPDAATRQVERLSLSDVNSDTQSISSPLLSSASQSVGDLEKFQAPPRPPKPANIREKVPSNDVNNRHMDAYDIPPPSSLSGSRSFIFPKDIIDHKDLSPSSKVPLTSSCQSLKDGPRDDYDFPRMQPIEGLNITVPGHGTLRGVQRLHVYSNAAAGLLGGKKALLTYEYTPSLSTSDIHVNSCKQNEPSGDVSNERQLSSSYANLHPSPGLPSPSGVPPAVNRVNKPRRISDGSSVPHLQLEPPPVPRNSRVTPTSPTNKWFPNSAPPPIPSRPGRSMEEALLITSGSRRNSNDDSARLAAVPPPIQIKDEIKYLDLNFDNEPSPSSLKARSPKRTTTDYKIVDAVKTRALITTKGNIEKSREAHKDSISGGFPESSK